MPGTTPPSDDGGAAYATPTKQEQRTIIQSLTEEDIAKALRAEELQQRSVTASPLNFACNQPSEFETLGAKPKRSQETESSHSYVEKKIPESLPPTSMVTDREEAEGSYEHMLQTYQLELDKIKYEYYSYRRSKRESGFPERAILGTSSEIRTRPSSSEKGTRPNSPERRTRPTQEAVSGESGQRDMRTQSSSISHSYHIPMKELPTTTGQSKIQHAELLYNLDEGMKFLYQSFQGLSLQNIESSVQMPRLSPQTHILAPPVDARFSHAGVQQGPMQQRHVIATQTGRFNIPPQIIQPRARAHMPPAAHPAFIPGPMPGPPAAHPAFIPRPVPGPPPAQQLPQPAPQIMVPEPGTTIVPLDGESKLKTSGHNYKVWVCQVKILLRREGTLQMVLNPPAQPWTPEIRNLETRACTTLLLSMDTDLLVIFEPDVTAHQIWIHLENCYRPISIESSYLLMSELHALKLKPGHPIGGHLTKLKSLRKDLGERDLAINDIQMVVIISQSLNHEWKDAVAKINQIPVHQRTVENVSRLLVEEEALMLATTHPLRSSTSRTPVGSSSRGRAYVPRMPRCQICDRVGHTGKDCPQPVPAHVTHQSRGTVSRRRSTRRGNRGSRREPTVRTESVKIALTTATILGLEVFQFDVDTAYLHADLDEDIYVKSPPGFQKQEGDTWYLNKSLYGLKQSGLMWHLCLTDKLNSMGFIKSQTDECVFTKKSDHAYEIVLVYVHDIVYIGPNKKMSDIFAKVLQKYFTLKSLGHINTYLGVQIEKTQKGFSLSQEDKIEQVLHNCNMLDANTTKTPMQTDFHNLTNEDSPEFEDQTLYRSVIGSLLYISSWTRPDISLSVNLLSRHVGKATQFHWSCIKKLLKYLKHTKHLKLLLEPTRTNNPELCCYADSDWASDKKSRKSTSGYMMFLNGCPVYWQVRKQNFISCSSTEAEYACVSDACNSLTWFDALVTDIWTSPIRPIRVMEDNESVVYISESHFTGSRSRHIDVCYRNTEDLVKQGFIKMEYVSTHEQIADMLNKPLPAAQHEYLRNKMCLN